MPGQFGQHRQSIGSEQLARLLAGAVRRVDGHTPAPAAHPGLPALLAPAGQQRTAGATGPAHLQGSEWGSHHGSDSLSPS